MYSIRIKSRVSALTVTLFFVGATAHASVYDDMIASDQPVLFLKLSAPATASVESDVSGNGNPGRYLPQGASFGKTRLPNGESATVFNGTNQYVQVSDAPELSVPRRGALTIEAWIRPDVLQFPKQEGDGYVHWAGKGETREHEYAMRMYSLNNSASRPNRISGYAFNLEGGLGSGSYFQDVVRAGTWIHVALIIDTRTSAGSVKIFKNGILRDTTPLSQFDVTPSPGNAPLRMGTRDLRSFFKGAMGKFAVYARALPQERLRRHYLRMITGR